MNLMWWHQLGTFTAVKKLKFVFYTCKNNLKLWLVSNIALVQFFLLLWMQSQTASPPKACSSCQLLSPLFGRVTIFAVEASPVKLYEFVWKTQTHTMVWNWVECNRKEGMRDAVYTDQLLLGRKLKIAVWYYIVDACFKICTANGQSNICLCKLKIFTQISKEIIL